MMHRCALAIAGHLGTDVIELPGDHVGYLTDPAEFAEALHSLLR
ncbi:hypothetical protein ACTWPT_46520 [Nonomuraea sp. 3N208]